MSYKHFALTLMVTHACNMRCTYCYTGDKAARRMGSEIAEAAICRAVGSVEAGGTLELGFFGGEPLLEAARILGWMDFSRERAGRAGIGISFHLTTNGTMESAAAWQVMAAEDLHLAVSCDGLPATHDRFRALASGGGTAAAVERTIRRLVEMQKLFSVIMVVRPDTVSQLPAGIRHLRALGVTSIEPSLDLWTRWSRADAVALRRAIAQVAELWMEGLPHHALNWFDEKAAGLARLDAPSTRCGFGNGEIAVAPSGNLYPCERLIGEDRAENGMRLGGHVRDARADFLPLVSPAGQDAAACRTCSMNDLCNTSCRCSNFVRTGNVRTPDGLLCMVNQACLEEVVARTAKNDRLSLPVLAG